MKYVIYILALTIWLSLIANKSMAQNLPGSGNATTGFGPGYVEIEDFPRVQFPITFAAWVRLEPFGQQPITQRFPIFSTGQGTATTYRGISFQLTRQEHGSYIEVQWGNGLCAGPNCIKTIRRFFNTILVNSDRMFHVAVVLHNTNQATIYVNGNFSFSTPSEQGNPAITNPAYPPLNETNYARIGAHQAGATDFFDGSIDEITVWNTARTHHQIREYMCKKVPPTANNLLAYYKLDELNATDTVVDSSPNNFFGVPAGTQLLTKEYSGAPIGDEADYNGPGALGVVHVNSLGDTVEVSNPSVEQVTTVHAYTVFSDPNHKNGIGADSSCMRDRYYGVFLAHGIRYLPGTIIYPHNSNYQIMDVSIRGNTPPDYFGVFTRGRNNFMNWQLETGPNLQGNEILDTVLICREFYPRLEAPKYDPDLPDTVFTCSFPLLLSAATLDVGTLSWDDSLNTMGRELSVLKPGNYTITASSLPCSIASISHTVTVLGETIEADTTFNICEGDSVVFLDTIFKDEGQFMVTRSSSFCDTIWEVNIEVSSQTIHRDTVVSLCPGETFEGGGNVFSEAGNYTFIEPDPDGCFFEYNLEIIGLSDSDIYIESESEKLCNGESLILSVRNHDGYPILWSTGETTQMIAIFSGGEYAVQVGGQCGFRHDTISILQGGCRPRLFIPNAFAPTGTGNNERFKVKGDGIQSYEISILDRWGNVIYHSTDLSEAWDGTYKGKMVPSAVYVYLIVVTGFESSEVIREQGTLYLLR
ncbi:MAG: gliding motility-associated C-terminal domain-containing protein [Cryomorphaceae bacterium]|nr:gliding motility-associated C-terminal domain-containing protein [Cryomorphaceae bacterium]